MKVSKNWHNNPKGVNYININYVNVGYYYDDYIFINDTGLVHNVRGYAKKIVYGFRMWAVKSRPVAEYSITQDK